MKKIIAILMLATSFFANAQTLREQCENAYYATGYVKLHQYKIVVNWARISDHALVELENILYSDNFKVLKEKELPNYKTLYVLKESNGEDPYYYEAALAKLESLTGNKASCVYDL